MIHKEGDKYYLDDKVVDANLIAALAKALTAPANPELSLDDLGVTPAWLKAHASSVAQYFAETRIVGNGGPTHPVHQALLESTFADPEIIDKEVFSLFDNRHYSCSDCKRYLLSVKTSVTFEDGTWLDVQSSSQFPYMLPWHLPGSGTGVIAYNADISRAIAALMPENSTNRSRLAGEQLDRALGAAVMMQVERKAQLLDIESKTGGTFSALRSRYTIESASIGNYGDPVLRKPEDDHEPDEPTLDLRLNASADLPTTSSTTKCFCGT